MALVALALLAMPSAATAAEPTARAAAVCADHPNQASAQRAKDTRDADGDGIYCEALPYPCAETDTETAPRPAKPKAPARPQLSPAQRRAAARWRRIQRQRRQAKAQEADAREPFESALVQVVDVVDGDTIRVALQDGREETVRLIGVDTPESVKPGVPVECGAREATDHVLRLTFTAPLDSDGDGLLDQEGGTGATVGLTLDPTQGFRDAFGRLLAFVDAADGGFDLAHSLIENGWSRSFIYRKPHRRTGEYDGAEAAASGGGAWLSCRGNFHSAQPVVDPQADWPTRLPISTRRGAITRLGALNVSRDPRLWAAVRAFGEPDEKNASYRGVVCRVRWSRLGLRATFINLGGGGSACKEDLGNLQNGTIKGEAGSVWSAPRGVSIGDSQTALRRAAGRRARNGRYWTLAITTMPYGESCPCKTPSVAAHVADGAVDALEFWVGAGGD